MEKESWVKRRGEMKRHLILEGLSYVISMILGAYELYEILMRAKF